LGYADGVFLAMSGMEEGHYMLVAPDLVEALGQFEVGR